MIELMLHRLQLLKGLTGIALAIACGGGVPFLTACILLGSLEVLIEQQLQFYSDMRNASMVLATTPPVAWWRLSFSVLLTAWAVMVVLVTLFHLRAQFYSGSAQNVKPLAIWGLASAVVGLLLSAIGLQVFGYGL